MLLLSLLATVGWCVRPVRAELCVTGMGKLEPGPSARDEQHGTPEKWAKVHEKLGEDAERVIAKQLSANLGGNTSVRSESPLQWKDKGYFRRARDLGHVFTAPHDFTLDAILLRTGNDHLAFLPGAAGAEVFVQFFEVIDEHDTYGGGWSLRREGNGRTPPLKVPGERPPTDPDTLRQLTAESTFPVGGAHYAIPPTCEGYPDVDTYRDLEFYILERPAARPPAR